MSVIVQASEELFLAVDSLIEDGKFEQLKKSARLYHEWGDDAGYVEGVHELADAIASLTPDQQLFEVEWDNGAHGTWFWFAGKTETSVINKLGRI